MVENTNILGELKGIVGDAHATSDKHIMYAYSYDMCFVPNKLPRYVAQPANVEEVVEIMKLCNKTKTPVIPVGANTNIGGLCIPKKDNTLMLDMRRMNKIIRIDEETRFAIVEPGVSHAQFAEALFKKGLRFGWPVGPPSGTVTGCALSHGISGMSGRYGLNSQMITSMEVVRPTGELCRVGSCAIKEDSWHSFLPLPRMDGIFTGWFGTTGIVTKLAVYTPAVPPHVDVVTCSTEEIRDMYKYMLEFGRYEMADDLTAVNWWLSQVPIPYPYKEKPADQHKWNSYAVLYGYTEKELEAKVDAFHDVIKHQQELGSTVLETEYPEEAKRGRTELPSQIVGSTKNYCKEAGGGISWPGTFTPANKWEEVYNKWEKIYKDRNLSPATRITMYRGIHYGMLRAMTPINKQSVEETENAKQAIVEALGAILDAGGIPYKPPIDFNVEINKRADDGYKKLMCDIKDMIDPNGIMNPGQLLIR